MAPSLRSLFDSYFEVVHDVGADPALLRDVYHLRYQVYCLEHGYEDPHAFPDGLERDSYDQRSLHTLLVHRATGLIAGTVRLIRDDPELAERSLPIDDLCGEPELHDQTILPRPRLAEVSRLAISKDFRKRAGESDSASGVGSNWRERENSRRRIPHLSLGLVQGMIRNSREHGIAHLVAEMEPALLRMLRHVGIYFQALGPLVEYHGRRQPCYAHIDGMLGRLRKERADVWELVTDGGLFA